MKILTAIWQAAWYELDQSIKVGLKDEFWFIKGEDNKLKFHRGLDREKYVILKCEVLSIKHKVLGDILEINTNGLSYHIFLPAEKNIQIDAEEDPGKIENDYPEFDTDNYRFTVELKII